ncbi:MAG: response regulator [Alphaproteobacteria bacterium]
MYQEREFCRTEQEEAAGASTMPRLLAVDDHPDSAELVARVAKRCGYEAHHASDSRRIRALLAETRPTLLSIDLCMPEMDGIELFEELKAAGYAGEVLLISGQSAQLRESAARLAVIKGITVVGNLQKPVDIAQLRILLKEQRRSHA